MKHKVVREYELTVDEVKEAVLYWLRHECDKHTPSLTMEKGERLSAVTIAYWDSDITAQRGATVAWSDDIGQV
jgi:hypothetical protein